MEYKHSAKITVFIFVTIFCLAFLAIAKGPSGGQGGGPNPSPAPSGEQLDLYEETHLKFMRAEEKLAHDVYKYLDHYLDPDNPVYPFANIVWSESNHQDSMTDKLRIYGIEDLNVNDGEGEFHPDNYGDYFLAKYSLLTGLGENGLLQALMVGGLIEELDMFDIKWCPKVIQETMEIEYDACGMEYTDEELLEDSFESLIEGSENHLRAFAGAILMKFADTPEYPYDCYKAQYLTQEEVNDILEVPEGTCVDDPEED